MEIARYVVLPIMRTACEVPPKGWIQRCIALIGFEFFKPFLVLGDVGALLIFRGAWLDIVPGET